MNAFNYTLRVIICGEIRSRALCNESHNIERTTQRQSRLTFFSFGRTVPLTQRAHETRIIYYWTTERIGPLYQHTCRERKREREKKQKKNGKNRDKRTPTTRYKAKFINFIFEYNKNAIWHKTAQARRNSRPKLLCAVCCAQVKILSRFEQFNDIDFRCAVWSQRRLTQPKHKRFLWLWRCHRRRRGKYTKIRCELVISSACIVSLSGCCC